MRTGGHGVNAGARYLRSDAFIRGSPSLADQEVQAGRARGRRHTEDTTP